MAVTITTQFYETDTPDWHDLAKIVFTSPNMDSPNTAGVRSHILPGETDLGLWYEDLSYMYRISADQDSLPTGAQHPLYMGILDLYSTEVFSFATDTSVLIDTTSLANVSLSTDDVVYYDGDNYGTVSSITTATSGTYQVEDRTITIDDSGFSSPLRTGYEYDVYWETTGVYSGETVNVYYSTNGGVSWVVVDSGVSNDGSNAFTIPTNSVLSRIKVESASTPSVYDVSTLFTSTPGVLDVLVPVTGVVTGGRTTHKVWWNSSNFFLGEPINIDISFNNGSTWTTVVSGTSNVGYATVNFPNSFSDQTKIKVYATNDPTNVYDISGQFTTQDIDSEVLTPAADDLWRNWHDHKVWWDSNQFYNDENVNIKISYDNGSSWATLASGILNTGYATVTLASGISATTIVKVEATDEPTVYDNSGVFSTIGGAVTVLSPDADDTWRNRHQHRVWWNSSTFYNDDYVNIKISYDNGGTWSTLASHNVNSGYATVTLASGISDTTKIRVESYNDPTEIYDDSEVFATWGGDFSIVLPGEDGYIYNRAAHKFWWNSTAFYNDEYVDVLISYDDGVTWETIVSNTLNTGYVEHTITVDKSGAPSQLKVRSHNDPTYSYDTNSFTVISGSSIDIKYPAATDTIGTGATHRVWWNSNRFYEKANLLRDDLSVADPFYCAIALYGLLDNSENMYDDSADTYATCNTSASENPTVNYTFKFSFIHPMTINEVYHNYSEDTASYPTYYTETRIFATNTTFAPGTYDLIYYNKYGKASGTPYNETYVDITENTTAYDKYCVNITYYLVGPIKIHEFYVYGYNASGSYNADTVDVLLSTNGGTSWTTLASGIVNTGYKNVAIPYNVGATPTALFKVRDHNNPLYLSDTNSAVLSNGTLEVMWPSDSGISVLTGEEFYAWWNSTYIYDSSCTGTVTVSLNDGTGYSTIKDTIDNDGYTHWVLNCNATTSGTVKVSKGDGTQGVEDVSDYVFTIEDPYINVVGPTSGTVYRLYSGTEYWWDDFTVGAGGTAGNTATLGYLPVDYKVWWNTNVRNNKNNFIVDFTTDGGANWHTILEDQVNDGYQSIREAIVASGTASTNCNLRVIHTNTAGVTVTGTSETFIIEPPNWELPQLEETLPNNEWTSTYYYNGYFYRIGVDNKIYKRSPYDSAYIHVTDFTEGVIDTPAMCLKNGNIYLIDSDNDAFYEYLTASGVWRTLTPSPCGGSTLESFGDNDNYIYSVGEDDCKLYRFDVSTYGDWTEANSLYEGTLPSALTYKKIGITTITGSYLGDDGLVGPYFDFNSNPYTVYLALVGVPLSISQDDLEVGAWFSGGDLLSSLSNLGGFGTQTAAVSAGGIVGAAEQLVSYEYDGTSWSSGGHLLAVRYDMGSLGTQSAGLVFGGRQEYGVEWDLATSEEYNGAAWSSGGTLNEGKSGVGGVGLQESGLAFGGYSFSLPLRYSDKTEEYNGSSWTVVNDMIDTKSHIAGCGVTDAALAFGGLGPQGGAYTYSYDGTNWSVADGMLNTARHSLCGAGTQSAALSFGGYPYISHLGDIYSNITNVTESYNGNTWTNITGLIEGRAAAAGDGTQTLALVFGGTESTYYAATASTEEWIVESIGGAQNGKELFTLPINYNYKNMVMDTKIISTGDNEGYVMFWGLVNYMDSGTPKTIFKTDTYSYTVTSSGSISFSGHGVPADSIYDAYYSAWADPGNATRYAFCDGDYNHDIESNGSSFFVFNDTDANIMEWSTTASGAYGGGAYSILTKSITTETSYYSGFLYDNNIYISGGTSSDVPFFKYDVVSGTWSTPENTYFTAEREVNGIYTNRIYDVMCTDGTYVYKFVGYGYDLFYKYNINTNEVTELTSPPVIVSEEPCIAYSSVVNKIYFIHDKDAVNNMYVYNVATNTWGTTDDAPYVIDRSKICSDDNYIYVVEGSDDALRLLRYDVVGDSWSSMANRPTELDVDFDTGGSLQGAPSLTASDFRVISVATNGDYLYTLGCFVPSDGASPLTYIVYEYNISTNMWRVLLKRPAILDIADADSYLHAFCVCDSSYLYIVYNKGEGVHLYKLRLTHIDYDTVTQPDSWVAPPADTMQTTQPGGWGPPPTIPYLNSAPAGWAEPPNSNYWVESQPGSWVAPTAYPGVESQPGGWSAPPAYSIESQPGGWVAPTDAKLEAQPGGWAAPINSADRKPAIPTLTPIASGPPLVQVAYATNLNLTNVVGNATISGSEEDQLFVWNHDITTQSGTVFTNVGSSIVFEVTNGECYNCRLTAWDDATHSTTLNELLMTDRCRVYALAFSSNSSIAAIQQSGFTLFEYVYKPVEDQILKGNVYYYGDFDMKYRYQSNKYGDYLIFRPYLYNINSSISYGVHDFLITLMYSYT